MATASQIAIGIGATIFVVGWVLGVLAWYHGLRMFLGRQQGLLPYVNPLWFLVDKYLDANGLIHRPKFLRYLLASITCFACAYVIRSFASGPL